ncbi:alpha/beta fold hydrolase [Algimonas porphyrae]|uniref:Class II poly(R)-hydroxyalkanoic acid synthase n=1 Tax=Algimonas porphyrae TaxID=1128113 RepID=A0ABQ5V5E0_9PROT|nr:alpha/beta fold hydrolase [Algimonas porphyrae]GLQ21890.1 class II poly(R)-hydroxyalkanoic acid synthase [Algimonas porphyrae]
MAIKKEKVAKQAAENTTAVNSLVGFRRSEVVKSLGIMAGYIARQPKPFAKHVGAYGKELFDIVKGDSELSPHPKDRRFQDETWSKNPIYKRGLQSWLAMRRELDGWINDSQMHPADKARAKFVTDLIGDTLAPTNSLIGNPAAMKKLYETGGMSLVNGLKNAYEDLRKNGGMPSQVDGRPFKVGENVANTPGAVVYKTEMLELIQYKPQTDDVHKTPLMIIPPQINKYYAVDLEPNKSMIRFLLKAGFQVFAVSWRNPSRQHSHWGLEEYVEELIVATDAVRKITRTKRINVSGACSGGTTMALMLSELAARGDDRINAFTLMVSVLDGKKSDSEIGLFVTDTAIEAARRHSKKKGILAGDELARSFAWMRPNDLIWNYVVNNYLLGENPPPFDVLFWNNDSTNLPAQLHSDYLDIFQKRSFRPDKTEVFMDHIIDLSAVTQDNFMVAGITDHITPWKACYRNVRLFGGDSTFVLSNSGHIQSLLNPPGNPKAQYFVNEDFPPRADRWLEGADSYGESWWLRWKDWLGERSGEMKAAPKSLGNKAHPPISKAPGEYVFT